MTTIAFNTKLRRPGCVIIQTALGATVNLSQFQMDFPSETWVTGVDEDMKVFPVTEEQYAMLIHMATRSINERGTRASLRPTASAP